jgi:hypothetical protein
LPKIYFFTFFIQEGEEGEEKKEREEREEREGERERGREGERERDLIMFQELFFYLFHCQSDSFPPKILCWNGEHVKSHSSVIKFVQRFPNFDPISSIQMI